MVAVGVVAFAAYRWRKRIDGRDCRTVQRLEYRDIAAMLGQSEFTIRMLASRFVWFIPATRVGENHVFRPEAVDIFRVIIQHLDDGISDEHLEYLFSKRYPVAEISVTAVSGTISPDAFAAINAPVLQTADASAAQKGDAPTMTQDEGRNVADALRSRIDELVRQLQGFAKQTVPTAARDQEPEEVDGSVEAPPATPKEEPAKRSFDSLGSPTPAWLRKTSAQ